MKRPSENKQNICGAFIRLARTNYEKRHHQRMTQSDLAARVQLKGLSYFDRVTVCRIERGTRKVNDIELKFIAEVLDVSIPFLLGSATKLPKFISREMYVAESEDISAILNGNLVDDEDID